MMLWKDYWLIRKPCLPLTLGLHLYHRVNQAETL